MTKTERSHIISKKDVPISQGYTLVINFALPLNPLFFISIESDFYL